MSATTSFNYSLGRELGRVYDSNLKRECFPRIRIDFSIASIKKKHEFFFRSNKYKHFINKFVDNKYRKICWSNKSNDNKIIIHLM